MPRYEKMLRDSDGWIYPATLVDAMEVEDRENFEEVWASVLKRKPPSKKRHGIMTPKGGKDG